jgi:L-ribulose-5-phosphate 4-epimerase
MLEDLKAQVLEANKQLVKLKLVIHTWGNVSAIDPSRKYVVIKPSGVSYSKMKEEDMVVVDLQGNIVEGSLKPSSDTATHLEIYRAFPSTGSVVHTHSTYATAFAQARRFIVCFGTTHADHFNGYVPVIPILPEEKVIENYEKNIGLSIVNYYNEKDLNASYISACLVAGHGPFVWGKTVKESVYNSHVLEEVARMNYLTETLNPNFDQIPKYLREKHFFRKHGENAYYGQK